MIIFNTFLTILYPLEIPENFRCFQEVQNESNDHKCAKKVFVLTRTIPCISQSYIEIKIKLRPS